MKMGETECGRVRPLVSLSLRLKDLLGPVTRVKKKKKAPGLIKLGRPNEAESDLSSY